mmetsp:Transcript_15602/g.25269  ORF Transcript_15602/g.25269 Transcript_15602/m.25269 type:complete len:316 (-) Transcript_15602:30-977(-)
MLYILEHKRFSRLYGTRHAYIPNKSLSFFCPPRLPGFLFIIKSHTLEKSTDASSFCVPTALGFLMGVGSNSPVITPYATRTPSKKMPSPVTPKNPLAKDINPMTTFRNTCAVLKTKYTSVSGGWVANQTPSLFVDIHKTIATPKAKNDPKMATIGFTPFRSLASAIAALISSSVFRGRPKPSTRPSFFPAADRAPNRSFCSASWSSAKRRSLIVLVAATTLDSEDWPSTVSLSSSNVSASEVERENRISGCSFGPSSEDVAYSIADIRLPPCVDRMQGADVTIRVVLHPRDVFFGTKRSQERYRRRQVVWNIVEG